MPPAFASGDPVEQALGPQCWNPIGYRVRHQGLYFRQTGDAGRKVIAWSEAGNAGYVVTVGYNPENADFRIVGAKHVSFVGAATVDSAVLQSRGLQLPARGYLPEHRS
jgi:hypothetical protein